MSEEARKSVNQTKSREEIAQAYSSYPWWYDVRGLLILTFAYRSTLWNQVRLFGNNVGSHHLEVAIGTGTLFDIILKWRRWKHLPATRVLGIDYAEPMLAGAMKRFAGNPDIELWHADVAALPYPDNTFDSANIANAVHCFPDIDAGFREVLRVLKPGAGLAANILLYPRGPQPLRWIAKLINEWGMRKGILVSPCEQDDIRYRLQAAGFEIVHEDVSGNTYNVLARKLK
ncbi:MAG: methyltransferase domain-containing protein [Candidatus Competibacter sp.]|nr:methyltransferase domain-containing protein [Candidatus Competibacter sp.]